MTRHIVLVRHSNPAMNPLVPPPQWRLSQHGKERAQQLTVQLEHLMPFRVVSSHAPKSMSTGSQIAFMVDVSLHSHDGLEEQERPAMPWFDREADRRASILTMFEHADTPYYGGESANQAEQRFAAAIHHVLQTYSGNLVIVTHGTVMALFLARYNDVSAAELWQTWQLPHAVVCTMPDFQIKAHYTVPDSQTGA